MENEIEEIEEIMDEEELESGSVRLLSDLLWDYIYENIAILTHKIYISRAVSNRICISYKASPKEKLRDKYFEVGVDPDTWVLVLRKLKDKFTRFNGSKYLEINYVLGEHTLTSLGDRYEGV